jgi:hypothetical protein
METVSLIDDDQSSLLGTCTHLSKLSDARLTASLG